MRVCLDLYNLDKRKCLVPYESFQTLILTYKLTMESMEHGYNAAV